MTEAPPSNPEPPPLPSQGKPWQFSMRTILLGITGFALLCVLISEFPAPFSQAFLGLIWIAATGWVVTGLFFARGDERAFCIGVAIVISSTWTGIGGRFLQGAMGIFSLLSADTVLPRAAKLWVDHSVFAVAAVANGYLCIRARRYFQREQ